MHNSGTPSLDLQGYFLFSSGFKYKGTISICEYEIKKWWFSLDRFCNKIIKGVLSEDDGMSDILLKPLNLTLLIESLDHGNPDQHVCESIQYDCSFHTAHNRFHEPGCPQEKKAQQQALCDSVAFWITTNFAGLILYCLSSSIPIHLSSVDSFRKLSRYNLYFSNNNILIINIFTMFIFLATNIITQVSIIMLSYLIVFVWIYYHCYGYLSSTSITSGNW